MAKVLLSIDTRDLIANSVRGAINGAVIEIRSGTQPANANLPATGSLLAQLAFPDPCAPVANAGKLTMYPVIEDFSAKATNVATWARIKKGGTVVMDCDVGVTGSGKTMELNTVNIVSGGPVRITSFTVTVPAG